MTGKCNGIFTRGPKKGQVCGRECKEGQTCTVHSKSGFEYRKSLGASKQFDNLVERTVETLENYQEILETLQRNLDETEQILYGIRIFLKDDTIDKTKHVNYIPFHNDNKHHAHAKKKTITKKKGTIKSEIKDVESKIEILEKVKELYNN
jgi:uncharacterized protein YukE